MNKEILIERLKSLGFKEYESKVLLVLLKGIPMSASEIAKDANIIRNSIYDILKNFVDKGYCNEIETNTILNYQVIDPAIILDKIIHDYKIKYENKLINLKDTFGELRTVYESTSEEVEGPDKNIQLIRGFNKHRVSKYIKLVEASKTEILNMTGPRRAIAQEANEDAIKFIKSGGVIKTLSQLHNNKELDNELIKLCEIFEKSGEQVKLANFNLPNIVIFDRETVFINLSGDKSVPKHKQADIIIKNKDFVSHMCDLFDNYWNKSLTIQEFKTNTKNHGI
ncbi:MAG TPA: helix-turn-helix domain-containing protein [Ignavibacteria bacterium]|nr:helix-turn-helix domain-containing protein [Ignavibacteria bacterium]